MTCKVQVNHGNSPKTVHHFNKHQQQQQNNEMLVNQHKNSNHHKLINSDLLNPQNSLGNYLI